MSRRHFLAAGATAATGTWAATSSNLGARVIRGIIDETKREIAAPQQVPTPAQWDNNAITASWLGHATVLINFFGMTVLTDPVLFSRIGANMKVATVGPKRFIAPALTPQQLPVVDLVLLSHAHMDHFDLPSLRQLSSSTQAVTAAATGDLLEHTRMKQVTELKWGEKTRIHTNRGDMEVEAFQVKHWGARWRHDKHRGFNGYILARQGKKIIFGGDTALCSGFREIRQRGPFELAIMPIGAYHPYPQSHCTPEEAVQMANEAGANYFLPVHHSTFPLGQEARTEPIQRLEAALEKERLALRDVGQTFCLN